MIRTVNGSIDAKDVKLTLSHEHLSMDLREIRQDNDSFLNDINLQYEELEILKNQGFNLIVDMSNQSMHRNPHHLKELSLKTQLEIVAATGYYLHQYHDAKLKNMTIEELKNEFISDITIGINGSDIKAGAMGELATSSQKIFESEKKVLLAAVEAQKETGCPIFTHVDHGNNAIEQINLLLKAGVNPAKTVIGHMDLVNDIDILEKILKKGFSIAFDTIGKNSLIKCQDRVNKLIKLITLGYEDQILLSQDISRQNYLKRFGGHGYGYLIDVFYPKISNKISPLTWSKLISKNLINILDF